MAECTSIQPIEGIGISRSGENTKRNSLSHCLIKFNGRRMEDGHRRGRIERSYCRTVLGVVGEWDGEIPEEP